jgi:hypothetical protein
MSLANQTNKHIREAIEYAESRGWTVSKQDRVRIFGGLYYVCITNATVAEYESCLHLVILKSMRETYVALSIAARTRRAPRSTGMPS